MVSVLVKLGLVGQHLEGSLSPLIHQQRAKTLGMEIDYALFEVKDPKDLVVFLKEFWDQGGHGLNITSPYKTFFQPGKSINTLSRGQHSWKYHSTDGQGFLKAIQSWEPESFEHWIFLGAGGVYQAILDHIPHKPLISVLNRSCWTQKSFQRALAGSKTKTLVIQGTPLVQELQMFCPCLPALAELHGALIDLNYKQPSPLVLECQALGILAQDGLSMLYEQAFLSQKIWGFS